MEKRVLGRGLDALIPRKTINVKQEDTSKEAVATVELGQEGENKEFTYLPLTSITSGTYQPRSEMSQAELYDLKQSIREKGVIQPIIVRPIADGQYEVVAGGRRFEAVKALQLSTIPAIIRELSNQDTLIFAIVENLQRQDLNPIDEAFAFKRLQDEFEYTLDDIAKFVGKNKTTVANAIRLLKLPQSIQQALQKGVISRSQARTILAAESTQKQEQLFNEIINTGMTVREIEKKVKKVSKADTNRDPFVIDLEDKLHKIFGTKVTINNSKQNKGKIIIEYYNLDDLERIVKKLK